MVTTSRSCRWSPTCPPRAHPGSRDSENPPVLGGRKTPDFGGPGGAGKTPDFGGPGRGRKNPRFWGPGGPVPKRALGAGGPSGRARALRRAGGAALSTRNPGSAISAIFRAGRPPARAPGRTPGILRAPKKAKKWPFLDPCGEESGGSGGAPPTHLILLRNHRAPSRARPAPAQPPPQRPQHPGGAGLAGRQTLTRPTGWPHPPRRSASPSRGVRS